MRIFHGLPDEPLAQPSFLTIGNFDGVHRGHQMLIESMLDKAHAAGCLGGVLTFDPHPLAVLRPDVPLYYLTTVPERVDILAAYGVDFVVILPFTRATAATTAADFMHLLAGKLRVQSLWVGPDFALGRGREGTPERLRELGHELGYELHPTHLYQAAGAPVHSSRVRRLLAQDGAVAEAAALLGRPYQIWGVVERGASRGRQLGYPTANLNVPPDRLVPAYGIYACWAWLGDRGYPAAVSIGVRPTFDNGAPSVEAHLIDYEGDLYGQTLGLSFVERLRAEQKFPNAEALIAQMGQDVANARRVLVYAPDEADGQGTEGAPGQQAGGAKAATSAEAAEALSSAAALSHGRALAWEELPHTADWKIGVHGESQRQIFTRAAQAMYALQDADPDQPSLLARAFAVTASDAGELLVAWLNRLLLDQELNGEMYTRFEIHDISPLGLRSTVYGYHGAPSHTAIKAVTYWDLAVTRTDAGWSATVTFDV